MAEPNEGGPGATFSFSIRSVILLQAGVMNKRPLVAVVLVVCGLLNKQVGGQLGISEITVKAHRGEVMRKMQAESLPDLVTTAARLGDRVDARRQPALAG